MNARSALAALGALLLSQRAHGQEVPSPREVAELAETAPGAGSVSSPGDDGMLIDEAKVVALALSDHPHIGAAQADRDAAVEAKRAGRRALIPDVQLSGRYTRLSSIPERYRTYNGFTFPQLLDNWGARAQLVVPLSELFSNLAAEARALGHAAQAAELEVVSARAQIAYEARAAFLRYWRSKLALDTAMELTRAATSQVHDQRARQEAGTVARNDVLTFEVALDAAVMAEQSARADLAAAEAMLRSFLPSLQTRALRVPDLPVASVDEPPPEPPKATGTSPQLASLQAQAEAARERAKSASLARLPKLSAFVAGDYAAPSPRVFVLDKLVFIPTWEAGARVEWSLSQLTSGSSLAERAKATQRALSARVEEARRTLDAERTAAVSSLRLAHERAQRAGKRVEHAAALAAARRGELEVGTALPLNVVLAETDLARAKNEYVDAFVERALALAKLDFIDGRAEPSLAGGGAR